MLPLIKGNVLKVRKIRLFFSIIIAMTNLLASKLLNNYQTLL